MKRSQLQRRTPLTASPDSVRAFQQRARENTVRQPRAISPASHAQRLKVADQHCLVCGQANPDPAHLIDRSLLGVGQDDARAVVPLCRSDHSLYDIGRIDLLPFEARFREELVFAVHRFGLLRTLQRVTGEKWRPVERAA